jgi:hypothetical protein
MPIYRHGTNKIFFTDKQLRERWHCSAMKLWRLRRDRKLSKPVKIGGSGPNLTPEADVEALEGDDA